MTKTQKFLLAAGFCCLMGASNMFATSINVVCGAMLFTNGTGTQSANCGSAASYGLSGVTITSIELWVSADYTGGLTGSNSTTVSFNSTTPSITLAPSLPQSCTVSGNSNSNTFSCNAFSGNVQSPGTLELFVDGGSLATAIGGFAVNGSSAMNFGAITGSSGLVIEEFDYTPSGGVPEPTTFVLMGAGLGLLGMLRRKTARR